MHMHDKTMNYNAKGRPGAGTRHQSARPGKPKQGRNGLGGPVDPDELSRRLYLVLADQKASAGRTKRAAKAEAAALAATAKSSKPLGNGKEALSSSSSSLSRGLVIRKSMSILEKAKRKTSKSALKSQPLAENGSSGPYVPREAAAQFALTTTATNMSGGSGGQGLVHKLSRNALKFHLEADHVDPNASVAEQTKALRRAQSRREQLHERNQFQRTRILEDAAELDEGREQAAQNNHRHTFTGGLSLGGGDQHHSSIHRQHQKNRRSSTGDFLESREKDLGDNRHGLPIPPASPGLREDSPPPKYCPPPHDAAEHRVDWTQSDEAKPIRRARTVPLLLKRTSSIWSLRGKFGGKDSKNGRGETETIDEAPELSKPVKVGFFSRFKR